MEQTSFDTLLNDTDRINEQTQFEKQVAHLPSTMAEAIEFHHEQIKAHHQAMLDCDFEKAIAIREDARLLALKLNKNKGGIIAHENAPGCVLARECAADKGTIPLWGQQGVFTITVKGIQVEITIDGMFGIGATSMIYAGFGAKAVDWNKSFISETGYRSFLGCAVTPQKEMTTEDFAKTVITHFLEHDRQGQFVQIGERFKQFA